MAKARRASQDDDPPRRRKAAVEKPAKKAPAREAKPRARASVSGETKKPARKPAKARSAATAAPETVAEAVAPLSVPASGSTAGAKAPRDAAFGVGIVAAAAGRPEERSGEATARSRESQAGAPPPPVPAPMPRLGGDDEWVPLYDPPRARPIPPIPEEADEFEPIEPSEERAPAREAPAGASPREVLEEVRRGRLHVAALSALDDVTLASLAREVGLSVEPEERRTDLLYRLLHERPREAQPPTYFTEGLLELLPDGYGFLRRPETGYGAMPGDAYVSPALVRRWRLATGHWISGTARAPRPGERTPGLLEVEEVNHDEPARAAEVVAFDRLTVTHPDSRYLLETEAEEPTGRLIDLFCPLGRGQRALVVSPPRAGKTIVLQRIADALARNSPEVEIVVLLVDERPEEVTNMRRSVRGEVIASTFDQPAHRHIRLVELVMEKVKRMVEYGRHVVLLVDSLTRIGRAYNNESHGTGRLLTGGLEASALIKPKRIFGAARNVEHGGSLTIVATALVDTGSRLDQVIFEEFKGSGNMELILDRDLANQRLYPAIDIPRSGTRKEELLLHPEEQRRIVALRREISSEPPAEALLDILEKFAKYRTNAEFLMRIEA